MGDNKSPENEINIKKGDMRIHRPAYGALRWDDKLHIYCNLAQMTTKKLARAVRDYLRPHSAH